MHNFAAAEIDNYKQVSSALLFFSRRVTTSAFMHQQLQTYPPKSGSSLIIKPTLNYLYIYIYMYIYIYIRGCKV